MASELGPFDVKTQQRAGEILWGWRLCGNCLGTSSCSNVSCPWNRPKRLDGFWDLYQKMVGPYIPHGLGRRPALTSHQDLLEILKKISTYPDSTKSELLSILFQEGQCAGNKLPDIEDQKIALNMAASIRFLMDFEILFDDANLTENSIPACPWRDEVTVRDFINEAFPAGVGMSEKHHIVRYMTASRLKKEGKLRLRATNDIRRHLVLDHEERVVWIFQHESALRELLNISPVAKPSGSNTSGPPNPVNTCLPRELIVEVLDTIHLVLFPIGEESYNLRKSLVDKHGFDKGLVSYISSSYRSSDDPAASYKYFASRLEALHREIQQPTPHGRMQKWLNRKSNTYMLMATMIGVFVAVVLGFLGLVVSTFQAYVTYQQWKHPAKDA